MDDQDPESRPPGWPSTTPSCAPSATHHSSLALRLAKVHVPRARFSCASQQSMTVFGAALRSALTHRLELPPLSSPTRPFGTRVHDTAGRKWWDGAPGA